MKSLEKQLKKLNREKKCHSGFVFFKNRTNPLRIVTYGSFEALALLVLQNAIRNSFYIFLVLEKNLFCFIEN